MLVIETLACVANTFVGERAGALFFPNPLSVSPPLVRALILQQNPPANLLFAQLPWYTLLCPLHFFLLFFS